VFEGYGVGLTVTPLGPGDSGPAAPPGVVARPSRLTEVLPVGQWTAAEEALELERIQSLKSAVAAYEAAVVMGFAGTGRAAVSMRTGRSREPMSSSSRNSRR
jgi:hypothetical protein